MKAREFFVATARVPLLSVNGANVIIDSDCLIVKGLLFFKVFKIFLKNIEKVYPAEGNFGINPTVKIECKNGREAFFMFWKNKSRDEFMNYLKKKNYCS